MYGIMYPGLNGGFPSPVGTTKREATRAIKGELESSGWVSLYRQQRDGGWSLRGTAKDVDEIKNIF